MRRRTSDLRICHDPAFPFLHTRLSRLSACLYVQQPRVLSDGGPILECDEPRTLLFAERVPASHCLPREHQLQRLPDSACVS